MSNRNEDPVIDVFVRQPSAAFSSFDDVPSSQDFTHDLGCFELDNEGLSDALEYLSQDMAEYSKSYGGRAVHSGWIEILGERYRHGFFRFFDEKFSGEYEWKVALKEHKRLNALAAKELDNWAKNA